MSDELSLTLPKPHSLSRVRVRRPKRPSFFESVCYINSVMNFYRVIVDFIEHRPVDVLFNAGLCIVWFRVARAARGDDAEGRAKFLQLMLWLIPLAVLWLVFDAIA